MDPDAAAALLAAERERTVRRLAAVSAGFDEVVAASRDTNADDEHDPEGATIAFERSQLDALTRQAREHLVELDAAADRLADGSFGRCVTCGGAIPEERLAIRPSALRCVPCAASTR